MAGWLARRLIQAATTLVGITLAAFFLLHSLPGDVASARAGEARGMSASDALRLRRELKLDQPVGTRYLAWGAALVRFDLGRSLVTREPVRTTLVRKLPNTLLLNGTAMAAAWLAGLLIALVASLRPGGLFDRFSSLVTLILYAIPAFWLALVLIHLLAVRGRLFPLYGMSSGGLVETLQHLALPAIVIAAGEVALIARFSRSALLEVADKEFLTTARAKGGSVARVLLVHAFRSALPSIVTVIGLLVPFAITGSVVVERIFEWDGIGRWFVDAVFARDYPVVMALTVMAGVATLLASLTADIFYRVLDPRLREGS